MPAKKGIIEAFCFTYGIKKAIQTFIPEIYKPSNTSASDTHYSYTGEKTATRVIILNDSYIYSRNAKDPIGNKLCNAWDMVRIHKFGQLDQDTISTPKSRLLSQKAMLNLVSKDENLARVMIKEHQKFINDMDDLAANFNDNQDNTQDPGDETSEVSIGKKSQEGKKSYDNEEKVWLYKLEYNRRKNIKMTSYNIEIILSNTSEFKNFIAYNEFTKDTVATKKITCNKQGEFILTDFPETDPRKLNGELWSDQHHDYVKFRLSAPRPKKNERRKKQDGWSMQVPDNILAGAINVAARKNTFHPIKQHICLLPHWDGIKRIDTLLCDYLGCENSPYFREIARLLFTAIIARIYTPGIQWEYVPVLMGPENSRKSTFVKILGFRTWAKELTADFHNTQQVIEQLRGGLVFEFPELTNIKKSDIPLQKAFLSRTEDRVRLAYARNITEYQRSCVFIGTTNEDEFLVAPENRRFWPIRVKVKTIDTEKLFSNMPQIWAEALIIYHQAVENARNNPRNIYFTLSEEAAEEAKIHQRNTKLTNIEDEDAPLIREYLNTPIRLSHFLGDKKFRNIQQEDCMVVRSTTCTRQLLIEALQQPVPPNHHIHTQRARSLAKSVRQIGKWITYEEWALKRSIKNDKITVQGYGRQRAFVRADATKTELTQGYVVLRENHKKPSE